MISSLICVSMRYRRLLPEDSAYFGCLHAISWPQGEPSGEKSSAPGEGGVSHVNAEKYPKQIIQHLNLTVLPQFNLFPPLISDSFCEKSNPPSIKYDIQVCLCKCIG